jgi:hypothetical protein
MGIPSIEYLASQGIIVSERVTIDEPNYTLTSKGWERDGRDVYTRDWFAPSVNVYSPAVCRHYNPSGRENGRGYGDNPHN